MRAAPTGSWHAAAPSTGRKAKWLTGANWSFTAPAGTDIVGFTHWRFAEARDSGGDDPNTPFADEGDHWEANVADDSGVGGGPAGGETCAHGSNVPTCTFGSPGGQRASHRVVAKRLSWNVGCGGQSVDGCFTSFYGYPLATMIVYPVRVRVRRQGNLPYLTGYSKRVTVHVR